jgi:hypothetical protein
VPLKVLIRELILVLSTKGVIVFIGKYALQTLGWEDGIPANVN